MSDLLPPHDRAERQLLVDLLAGRMSERAPAPRFGAGLDARRFLGVIPESLYPLVHKQLAPHADALGVPGAVRDVLAAHYRGNAMLQMKRRAMLRQILGLLDAASIPHLVLKGPVLAHSVYPDPATRTMSDLDLLVQRDHGERALALLQANGFRIPDRLLGATLEPGDLPPLEMPGTAEALVELHTILDSTGDDVAATALVWSRAVHTSLGGGLTVPTLAPADFLAHVAAHASKHHRFDGGLRTIVDVALLLRAHPALDWPRLRDEWQRLGIDRWLTLTFVLAHRLLDAPLPPGFEADVAIEEALALAAPQLWSRQSTRVPPRITAALAGGLPTRAHSAVAVGTVAMPRGVAGAAVRMRQIGIRLRRVAGAVQRGALRPKNLAATLDLFKRRERLAALLDPAPPPAQNP